jgi:hypothetical protein
MLKITNNYSVSRKISNIISDISSFQTAIGSLLKVHALTVQASNWSDYEIPWSSCEHLSMCIKEDPKIMQHCNSSVAFK